MKDGFKLLNNVKYYLKLVLTNWIRILNNPLIGLVTVIQQQNSIHFPMPRFHLQSVNWNNYERFHA